MKKLVCCLCILVLLASCMCAASAAGIPRVGIRDKNGNITPIDQFMQDGQLVLTEDEEGYVHLCVESDDYYRIRLSGISLNGREFERLHTSDEYSTYYDPAEQPGTYGPYRLQIIGPHVLEYDVMFVVPRAMHEGAEYEYKGFAESGYTSSSEFAEYAPPVAVSSGNTDIAFRYMDSNRIYSGLPGYALGFSLYRGAAMPDVMSMELRHRDSGEVIVSEQMDFSNWGESTDVHHSFIVPEFISGDTYDLVISDENGSVSTPVVMVDESMNVSQLEPGDLIVGAGHDENYDLIPLESYPQENGIYQIPADEEGYIWFGSSAGDPMLVRRYMLSGQAEDGTPFAMHYYSSGESGMTGTFLNNIAGTYGPYDLTVTAGNLVQEYKVQFILEHSFDSNYWPLTNNREIETPSFASVYLPSEEASAKVTDGETSLWFSEWATAEGTGLIGKPGAYLSLSVQAENLTGYPYLVMYDAASGETVYYEEIWYDGKYDQRAYSGNLYTSITIPSFVSGKEYEFVVEFPEVKNNGENIKQPDIRLSRKFILYNEEEVLPMEKLAPIEASLWNDGSTIAGFDAIISELDTIATGQSNHFWHYRSRHGSTSENLLETFSVYDPSANSASVKNEVYDLVASANWTVYDQYQFQFHNGWKYPEAKPVNAALLNEQFGAEWKEMTGFDFAQGFYRSEDGTLYHWMPVYFADAEGGIQDGRVYLYVLQIREGEDIDFMRSQYTFYFDLGQKRFRLERMLITDQKLVADVLRAMRDSAGGWPLMDTSSYEPIGVYSTGRHVELLQRALKKLNLLEASADGVYRETTAEAIKAFQKSANLDATGEADAMTLAALYEAADTRPLLLAWLEAQP